MPQRLSRGPPARAEHLQLLRRRPVSLTIRSNLSPIFSSTAIDAWLSGAVIATMRGSLQVPPAVRQDRRGRFSGIPLRPVSRQKRKAHVDVGKSIALHQTADADGQPAAAQRSRGTARSRSADSCPSGPFKMYSRASASVLTPLSPMKRKNAASFSNPE